MNYDEYMNYVDNNQEGTLMSCYLLCMY